MTRTNEVYYLFDTGLDTESKVKIVNRLHNERDFESINPEEERELAEKGTLHWQFRYDPIRVEMRNEGQKALPDIPCVKLRVDNLPFSEKSRSEDEAEENVAVFLELLERIYHILRETHEQPLYVIAADRSETPWFRSGEEALKITVEGVRNREIEEVFWGQILPPRMIDTIGKDKIMSTPTEQIETLSDGAVLFTLRRNPYYFEKYPVEAQEHFGIE